MLRWPSLTFSFRKRVLIGRFWIPTSPSVVTPAFPPGLGGRVYINTVTGSSEVSRREKIRLEFELDVIIHTLRPSFKASYRIQGEEDGVSNGCFKISIVYSLKSRVVWKIPLLSFKCKKSSGNSSHLGYFSRQIAMAALGVLLEWHKFCFLFPLFSKKKMFLQVNDKYLAPDGAWESGAPVDCW